MERPPGHRQIIGKTGAAQQKGRILEPLERSPRVLAYTFRHRSHTDHPGVGGSKALTGGKGPSKRSSSTRASCPVQPCASFEVPASRVSTFGLPWPHIGRSAVRSSGSYQAPV